MARLAAFAFVAYLLTGVSCLQAFINPPAFGAKGDFSSNPTYAEDSTINIAWTEGEAGARYSLVLYQLYQPNGSWFGDMEYLTKGAVGETNYSWLVGTRKNLSISNLFYLSLYQEGMSVSNMNSHYFNIGVKGSKEQSQSSSSSSVSSSSTLSTSSITSIASSTSSPSIRTSTSHPPSSISPTSEPISTPSSSQQSSLQSQPSHSFPIGAVVGIGVGILVALVMCLGGGCFLFRRRRKTSNVPTATSPYVQNDYRHNNGSYYGSNLNEAPLKSPVEMGQHGGFHAAHHNRPARQAEEMSAEPVRYEM